MSTPWPRAELETAFRHYQDEVERIAGSGDWQRFADLFTEDATYREHAYGTFAGREEIRRWIVETMTTFPGSAMPHFPIDWYVIDEDRGWIVCKVWNRMRDPGDGSVHQEYNLTVLHYAGNDRFSYEEDIYNPHHFGTMLAGWEARRDELEKRATG